MSAWADKTDRDVMRLVQADDVEAFSVLYDRLAPRALRVACVLCADGASAEDAVQAAFVSMWRGRARYRPERGEVHAWALGIVRDCAIGSPGRAPATRPANGDLESAAAAGDDGRRLQALLAGLPRAQREVVALAYFGELSHSEIARQLALPAREVTGRMRLGLAKLREHLTAA